MSLISKITPLLAALALVTPACQGADDGVGASATEGDTSSTGELTTEDDNCNQESGPLQSGVNFSNGCSTSGNPATSGSGDPTDSEGTTTGGTDDPTTTDGSTTSEDNTTGDQGCEEKVTCEELIKGLRQRKGVHNDRLKDGSEAIRIDLNEFGLPPLGGMEAIDEVIAAEEDKGEVWLAPGKLDPSIICADYSGELTGIEYLEILNALLAESCSGLDIAKMIAGYHKVWGAQLKGENAENKLTSCGGEAEIWAAYPLASGFYVSVDTNQTILIGTQNLNGEDSGFCGPEGAAVKKIYITVQKVGNMGGSDVIESVKIDGKGSVALFKGTGNMDLFDVFIPQALPLILETEALLKEDPTWAEFRFAGTGFITSEAFYPLCVTTNAENCQ